MKPAAFIYRRPSTVDEALTLLAEGGDDCRPLAGGQSLVPLMNFRLARPTTLVDLNRIPALAYIEAVDGGLHVGAMTRQRELERNEDVARRCPLLHKATVLVAHPQIRNRGTIGGSLAHADPSAEYGAATLALGASLVVRGQEGETRSIPAEEFFVGPFMTALRPGELLVEVRLPNWPTGIAFLEFARRQGDFAIAGVAIAVAVSETTITRCGLALAGVGPTAIRASTAEQLLTGEEPSDELFREVAREASLTANPTSDVHGTDSYRRALIETLTLRGLVEATRRVEEKA